jgi:hypothetical protein
VGTERGAYFSIDRGGEWVKFKNDFPIVPVDDIAVHPRENDLIFGTHGRSIWILDDITPLEQLSKEVLDSSGHLFDIRPAIIFNPYYHKGSTGHKIFIATNPPYGAMISYYLKEKSKKDVEIIIKDSEGKTIRRLKGKKEAGINRITWDLRYGPPPALDERESSRFRARGPFVLPGTYEVILQTEGQELKKQVKVEGDPRIDITFQGRKAQHDALYSIYTLYPALSQSAKRTDSIRKEINKLKQALKKVSDIPEAISEKVETISKDMDDIRIELQGDPKLGWRGRRASLRGRIMMLFRSIGGYTAAPTQSQLAKLEKYREELKALVKRINVIIETEIAALNKLMNEHNIPRVFPGEKIKLGTD